MTALSFAEPDRVPVDFWGSGGFYRMLEARRGMDQGAFLDYHDVDFRYIAGPRYLGPPLVGREAGVDVDIWGVRRRRVKVATRFGEEVYQEVAAHPLGKVGTVEEVEAYAGWPSPDWFDYSPVRGQCEAVRGEGRVAVFMGDRLNRVAQLKPAMYLRGMEQVLVDMVASPAIIEAIVGRVRAFYCEYLTRILEAAGGWIDIVLTGDDFGAQNGPLVSPRMWERFLGEGFADYMRIVGAAGAYSMHHTCGMVTPLVAGLAARGLRVLQSLQPEAMAGDFAALKREFGGCLAFQGGLSIQRTLPHGTPDDARDEVAQRIETFAPGGGYILCTAHNVQADCPLENVEAMLAAGRELGRY